MDQSDERSFGSDLLRHLGLGSLIWGVGLGLFGVAEMLVNFAVGLYQPASVWAFIIGVYLVGGLVVGVEVGLFVGVARRIPFLRFLKSGPVLMALFLAGYLFVFVGLPLNDRYLPGFFDTISLMTNGGLGLICAGLGALAYLRLSSREGGRLALAYANMALWWCIVLSGGMYVDMYIAASAEGGSAMMYYVGILAGSILGYLVVDRFVVSASPAAGAAAIVVFGLGWMGVDVVSRGFTPEAAAKGSPNVLWIVMDTTRPDHLSVYGYEKDTSPNLKAMAEDAAVFEKAIAQSSWTMPTHFQMVTSKYAAGKSKTLTPEFETIAEMLKGAGYDTGAVLANYSLGRRSGFDQGFDKVMDGPVMVFFHKFIDKLPFLRWLIGSGIVAPDTAVRWFHRHTFLEGVGCRAEDIANRAIDWIEDRGDRPFFMFMNFMDPHDAFDPPQPYRDRFAKDVDPMLGFVRFDVKKKEAIDSNTFIKKMLPGMTQADWDEMLGLYDGEIAYTDEHIGRIFDMLKARGLWDDTIIVLTADHGELFGEHGLAYHFKSLSDEEIHVPLVIRFPRSMPQARIATPVEVNDALPTVLELTGVSASGPLDGESLVTLASEGDDPEKMGKVETFSYLLRKADKRFAHTAPGDLFGRRTAGDKYVASENGFHEYYELENDPKAHQNLFKEGRPGMAASAAQLGDWRKREGLENLEEEKMDRLQRERLRALGYID